MSEQPAKIRLFWLLIVAVLALLLGFLVRGCGKKPGPVYIPVDLDSLRTAWEATFPKDTLILPGQITHTTKTRVVNLKDTAEVNALRRELEENAAYSAAQLASLQKALGEYRAKDQAAADIAAWNMLFKVQSSRDSVITPTYRYWWETEAEGKILSHRFGITPILPDCPGCEPLPVIRNHRIGAFAGLQTNAGTLRQVYGVTYRYKWAQVNAGYLPKADNLSAGLQFTIGADIGIK